MKVKVKANYELTTTNSENLEFELTEEQVNEVNCKIKEDNITNLDDLEGIIFDELGFWDKIVDTLFENGKELSIIACNIINHDFKLLRKEDIPCCSLYTRTNIIKFCPRCGKELNR